MIMNRMFGKGREGRRGSALILVVLLTLILSAMAIVALRDVARTTRATSVYRTRTQAQLTSDAAGRVFADYAGSMAAPLLDAASQSLYGAEAGVVGAFGGAHDDAIDLDGDGTLTLAERRRLLAVRGAVLEFDAEDLTDDCNGACPPLLQTRGGEESGLFRTNTTEETFETRRTSEWRLVARDFMDGFPAPGYGEGFCFKKALVASEARIGIPDQDWNRSNNVGTARHGFDVMLGPVECGYN